MGAQERAEEPEGEGFSSRFPPLRGVVWGRFGVVALMVWATLTLWVTGLQEVGQSCMGGLALIVLLPILSCILLLCFALPSFVIALGILQRSHAAIAFALLYDLLIVGFCAVNVIFALHNLPPNRVWDPTRLSMGCAHWVVLGLAFAAEAAYIIRRAWKWRLAWPAFVILAAGTVSIVAIVPRVLWAPLVQHVQPLLVYVNTHWVNTPPGARLALGQRSTSHPGHADQITILDENVSWHLSVEHRPDGRWFFPKARYNHHTFRGVPSPATAQRLVTSPDEAKMLLLHCGVVDTDLQLDRVVTKHFSAGTTYEFWLWSPLGQGRYRVYCPGGVHTIDFYLEQRMELP